MGCSTFAFPCSDNINSENNFKRRSPDVAQQSGISTPINYGPRLRCASSRLRLLCMRRGFTRHVACPRSSQRLILHRRITPIRKMLQLALEIVDQVRGAEAEQIGLQPFVAE